MDVCIQASSGPSPKNIPSINPTRRTTTTYHPSIWGDYFLKYSSLSMTCDDSEEKQESETLREQVRKMILNGGDEPDKQLKLIDEIQRLGVSYHFKTEIDMVLDNEFLKLSGKSSDTLKDSDDLLMASLRFRLLRQHGYHVSSDIFKSFMENKSTYKDSLVSHTRGLLSLYEAAHMRVDGEHMLDEALEFTTRHLEQLNNSLYKVQVLNALYNPIRKSLNRIQARRYIPIYRSENSHIEALLRFAILDFNNLQKAYQRELSRITMWWKGLNVAEKLPFARDRIVELYFWITGVYYEPQYSFAREILTKVIGLTSILDDTFDNYGTIDELSLFNDAIQRWDVTLTNQLPEYMQHIFRVMIDVYCEMEVALSKQGRSHHIQYAKLVMKNLVRAYFHEAKWYEISYVPTFEEYIEVALVSGAHEMLATTSFVVGMPELVTDEVLNWIISDPLVLRGSSIVCRLTDDMVWHEFEQERGHVASAIETYMKQYGATKANAQVELNQRISDAWKDMNQGSLMHSSFVPMSLVERILNLARVINLLYKDEDGYTHPGTKVKDLVTTILVNCVPL